MILSSAEVTKRRVAFKKLHQEGCFVIPNPWDVGSAKLLEAIGFKALATTSSGHAWSLGHADGTVSRDNVIKHVEEIVGATTLPVNADFGNGYGADANDVAQSVTLLVRTGVAGLSIEDATGDLVAPLFPLDIAVTRMQAARAAIDMIDSDTLLVGRAENFLVGQPDLNETIRRLKAYAAAGADCLYAPGIKEPDQIAQVVAALSPKPFNLLVGGPSGLTVAAIAALGVRRISLGGALARVALGSFDRAARDLAQFGRFDQLAGGMPGLDLNTFFDAPKLKAI
jgi:2-methylisocitrate lyase-like PEP mutase family enzyme